VTWRTLRAFLEITVAAVVVPSHRSLHRDGLPDGEYLVFSIWSSRRLLWADTQPFLSMRENSILNVKEMSNVHGELKDLF
jgi:hypothetical protein